MAKYSVREVVEMAVQTEKAGFDFYTEMAEKFKDNEDINELFSKLALREKAHEQTFTKLMDALGDKTPEGWDEASKYIHAMVESAFFLGKEKSSHHMKSITDYRQAVGLALAFEKETLLYFYGMRDVVKEKGIIDEIINEEQSHIMWLTIFRK